MTINSVNQTPDSIKEDSGLGRSRLTGFYVGVVKGNSDPQRMGRLSVYIPELGGNPEDEATWYVMSYASPFAGASNLDNNTKDGEQAKKMTGTQTSYGWWAVPPDINNEVLCCFANGDTSRGIWIRSLYQQFMNHMVPAIGLNLSTDDEINKKNLPPVCEYNRKDASQNIWDPKRPPYEPLHDSLVKQGLYTDPERGPATTGARRESPSKVFGFNTPRGNTLHIDDDETNEFIRFRTRSGVQLILHETTGFIYMISKEGNSWFELSDEGINMYSKRSISMRAEENINMHAGKGVYHHAAGGAHARTGNHTAAHESDSNTETSNNRQTTTGGTDTKTAPTSTRQSGDITDATGPKKPGEGGGAASDPKPQTPSGNPQTSRANDYSSALKPSSPGNASLNNSALSPEQKQAFAESGNPGRLPYDDFAKANGATGAAGGVATFPTYEAGRGALEKSVFEGRYAGGSAADYIKAQGQSASAIDAFASQSGLDMNAPLKMYDADQRASFLNTIQKQNGWY